MKEPRSWSVLACERPWPSCRLERRRCHRESQMHVRAATEDEIDLLARIWHDGWRDAHAEILPAELGRIRTFESLRDRLPAMLPSLRTIGAPGAPIGFHFVRDR